MSAPRERPGAEGAEGCELERELALALGGFETLDWELALDGRRVADLVGLCAGRTSLALRIDGSDGRAIDAALETLSFARTHAAALAAHLAGRGAGEPRVLLISARPIRPELLQRLRALAGPALWIFERRRLDSERGSSAFLERVAPPPERAVERASEPEPARHAAEPGHRLHALEQLLRTLAPEEVALARELAARIARIETEIECELELDRERDDKDDSGKPGAGRVPALAFRHRGELVCRLYGVGGRLEGRLPGGGLAHRIHSAAAADVFLDWVLALHLARLEEGGELPEDEEPPMAPRAEQILTREEIEAFRT